MNINDMHFTGTIWRPPYEGNAALIQATTGCTHHSCKFCSLYGDIKFRMSPKDEFEHDLKIIQRYQPKARRLFLVGANPFAMSYDRLLDLGFLIRKYLPDCKSIGMFARVTDITRKSVEELKNLRHLGFNGITVGTESGDDITLSFMNKKTSAGETIENLKKLDEAGIEYYVSYLTGLRLPEQTAKIETERKEEYGKKNARLDERIAGLKKAEKQAKAVAKAKKEEQPAKAEKTAKSVEKTADKVKNATTPTTTAVAVIPKVKAVAVAQPA